MMMRTAVVLIVTILSSDGCANPIAVECKKATHDYVGRETINGREYDIYRERCTYAESADGQGWDVLIANGDTTYRKRP